KLPKPVQEGYEWHSEDNRRQAVEDAEALWLSMRYGISNQIAIYTEQLLDLYHKDKADRVHDLVQQATGYDGRFYHLPKRIWEENAVRYGQFAEVIKQTWRDGEYIRNYWEYVRLQDYGQRMPLHALRVLALLEANGIAPETLWVATRKEDRRSLPK